MDELLLCMFLTEVPVQLLNTANHTVTLRVASKEPEKMQRRNQPLNSRRDQPLNSQKRDVSRNTP